MDITEVNEQELFVGGCNPEMTEGKKIYKYARKYNKNLI